VQKCSGRVWQCAERNSSTHYQPAGGPRRQPPHTTYSTPYSIVPPHTGGTWPLSRPSGRGTCRFRTAFESPEPASAPRPGSPEPRHGTSETSWTVRRWQCFSVGLLFPQVESSKEPAEGLSSNSTHFGGRILLVNFIPESVLICRVRRSAVSSGQGSLAGMTTAVPFHGGPPHRRVRQQILPVIHPSDRSCQELRKRVFAL